MDAANDLRVKERNADYLYESFQRAYGRRDFAEACNYLWKANLTIISALGAMDGMDVRDIAGAKAFLYRFLKRGDISNPEISSLEVIYANRARSSGDEPMLTLHIERCEKLLRKLKVLLKDYILNGPMNNFGSPGNTGNESSAEGGNAATEPEDGQGFAFPQ
ncbi:MAG: hypothetical protein JW727_01790 [Candidatus Aenigmarchaeota archaeon]|nr:hypothetical protein [Candidatus Aenigmarchaeota archaeon]